MPTARSTNLTNAEPAPDRRSDKRLRHRYPIVLDVNYKVLQGARELQGSGRTLNISSSGVLMEASSLLPFTERSIELAIRWPFLLEGSCPLNLVMRGLVVRMIGKCVAVEVDNYEFRIARRAAANSGCASAAPAWPSRTSPAPG